MARPNQLAAVTARSRHRDGNAGAAMSGLSRKRSPYRDEQREVVRRERPDDAGWLAAHPGAGPDGGSTGGID